MAPGQVVRIQSLPDSLQTVSRTLHLEAEVIRQNNDGSTRIRTAEGDMDIVVKGRQPQPGQRMEIEIPPGSPPQKAVTRPAPQAPAQPLPQQPPTQDGEVPQLPPPPPQTPVTQKPPVQGQAPQTTPITTMPSPKPDGANAPRPVAPPLTADAIKNAVGSVQDKALFTQQTYNAGGQQTQAIKTAIPQTQISSPNITGNNQTIIGGFPVVKAADILQLGANQIVKLVPVPASLPESLIKPDGTGAAITPPQSSQKSQGNIVSSLFQAMKTALPQSITNAVAAMTAQAKPSVLADGSAIIKTPMTTGMPAPLATGTGLTLPDGTVLSMPALDAKILSVKSPSGQMQILTPPDAAEANSASKAQPLTLNVTAVTAQKLPVVSIPINAIPNATLQNFIIPVQSPMIDTGAQITILPQAPQNVPPSQLAALPPAWRPMLPLMQSSSLWHVMDDLFQTFAGTTPQAAQILGRIIPSPANGANMGPAMILFAAAMKSGDLQAWVGDKKLAMLQKLGKSDLLSRLGRETSALRGNADAPATDWKSFPIPMLWQNEISKVMFHVRQEPRDEHDPNGETGTRFVFDLDLTHMGEVQLDGLLRGSRLDLIVRTKESISYPMQEAMKKAYADALVGTEIFGELGFQGDIKAWMTVTTGAEKMKMDL